MEVNCYRTLKDLDSKQNDYQWIEQLITMNALVYSKQHRSALLLEHHERVNIYIETVMGRR